MTVKIKNLFYSIEGLEAEKNYQNYLTFLDDQRSTRDFIPGDLPVVNAVAEQYLKGFSFKEPGKPSETITINKFKVLVHLLISRNHKKENHSLNSTILKQIVGPNYNLMLQSLVYNGIVTKSDYYAPGKASYQYSINKPYKIKIRQNKNIYVKNELDKLSGIFLKNEAENRDNWQHDNFIKQYQKNLNKIKLAKYDFHKFIEQLPNSERSKVTYYEVINKYKRNIFILSEDERKRLYSTLTRTPKLLKQFLNIKFQCDVKNSHPLLFSYFLIINYNIDINIIKEIYNIPYINNNTYPNVGQNLCKQLKTSTQKIIRKNKIPTDVISYIYMTSTGYFWDHFKSLPEFNHVPRYLIKVKIFEEVFYSNKFTSWQRDFAKAFQTIYPTVYSTILDYRKEAKTVQGEHLAHKMTRLESEIFRKILQRTWDAGMETTNIHDALILLDTTKNVNFTEAQVDEIIKSVYLEYGLMVTLDTEFFSIEKSEDKLKQLKNNKEEYDKFIVELKDKIVESENDEDTQNYYFEIWEDIENGDISVEFENGEPYVIFNN